MSLEHGELRAVFLCRRTHLANRELRGADLVVWSSASTSVAFVNSSIRLAGVAESRINGPKRLGYKKRFVEPLTQKLGYSRMAKRL